MKRTDTEKIHTKLEKLASKWNDLEADLKQVKTWTMDEVPISIGLLQSDIASSDEKLTTNEQLQAQLATQEAAVQKLHETFDFLTGERYFLDYLWN